MSLSSGLTLTDLSDYLAPSQVCIKPATMVEDTSLDPEQIDAPFTEANAVGGSKAGRAQTQISIEQDGYYESGMSAGQRPKKLKKAEITLNDCLACSGCITSAESVLVSMQSHEEVYRVLAERPDLMPIVSIAPQSLASLATVHNLTISATLKGLRRFFKKELGFKLVFDTTYARSLSLSESRLEFLSRSVSASATTSASPILSSSCPGWICYAEKTHGELLPMVSKVKSSQAIMGVLIKGELVAGRLGKRPNEIYHVTVMPCYDKKLEASRPDFATPFQLPNAPSSSKTPPVRDVDCVLTTGEVERMLNDKELSLEALANDEDEENADTNRMVEVSEAEESFFPSLLPSSGTSSGGYLFQTVLATLSTLSEEELGRVEIVEKRVKGEDYVEYLVMLGSPSITATPSPQKTLLRAAKCYGFRNLQNLVRKVSRDAGINTSKGGAAGRLPTSISGAITAAQRRANAMALMKRKKDAAAGIVSNTSSGTVTPVEEEVERAFDFVEVMACPGGCVNGGGQIAAPKTPFTSRKAIAKAKTLANGRMEKVDLDDEGMPDFSRVGLLGEGEELKGVMEVDDQGNNHIILSPKDWVKKVEQVYWEMEGPEHESSITIKVPDGIDESVKEYYLELKSERNKELERLREETLEVLLKDVGNGVAEREMKRRELFRTEYRAVEEEEVNGLAVKW